MPLQLFNPDPFAFTVSTHWPSKACDELVHGDIVAVAANPFGKDPISLVCRVSEATNDKGYAGLWVLNGHWHARVWMDELTHIEYPSGVARCEVYAQPARVVYVPEAGGQQELARAIARSRNGVSDYSVAMEYLTRWYQATFDVGWPA